MVKFKVLDKNIRARLTSIEKEVADLPEVLFIYLFGSYARGDENNLSDIDIAYYLSPQVKNKEELEAQLYDRVSSHLQTDEITFVSLNDAPLYLSHRVIIEGIVLYERDKEKRMDFIERINKLYLDFLPLYRDRENVWI